MYLNKSISANRPIIWVASQQNLLKCNPETLLKVLPIHICNEYALLTSAKRKKEFLLSRYLLQLQLNYLYPAEDLSSWILTKSSPFAIKINQKQICYVSISHSKDAIAIGLSPNPIGIDIEQMKARSNQLTMASEFMSPQEIDRFNLQIPADRHDFFYQCWSQKEAVYKVLRSDRQQKLQFKRLDLEEWMDMNNCKIKTRQLRLNNINYVFSITALNVTLDTLYMDYFIYH